MRCHCLEIQNRWVAGRVRTCKTGESRSSRSRRGLQVKKFREERTIQCEMIDEAMVPRVPNLPPGPSARQIVEHELTGHAVYRSWCRNCVASKGRAHAHSSREEGALPEIGIDYGFFGRDREDVLPILCVKCRNSSTGCVGATVVDRKGASDNVSSFLTASRVWDSREFW